MTNRYANAPSGADLRARRKAAGLTKVELARRAEVGRQAVAYWEAKARLVPRGWAPSRMVTALGLPEMSVYLTTTRARDLGVLAWQDWQQRFLDRKMARHVARIEQQAARHRQPCGARTRKGHPCRLLSEPGKRRCEFHGGKSTGPRTAEGRARIAEAQRRRWARFQEERAVRNDMTASDRMTVQEDDGLSLWVAQALLSLG